MEKEKQEHDTGQQPKKAATPKETTRDQRAGTLCHSSAGQDGAKKGPFSTAIKHIILVSYSLLLTASQFIVPTGLEDASTCSPWGHLRDDSTLSWEEKNKEKKLMLSHLDYPPDATTGWRQALTPSRRPTI